MDSSKVHPAVRKDDGRVVLNEHTVRAFVELITGELTQDEEQAFTKQVSSGQVKITNKALLWLRDNYGEDLRSYFEAIEMRIALGWFKASAAQMKAINSLEQRMGWRDVTTGRLKPKIVKDKISGTDYKVTLEASPAPEIIEAEKE